MKTNTIEVKLREEQQRKVYEKENLNTPARRGNDDLVAQLKSNLFEYE